MTLPAIPPGEERATLIAALDELAAASQAWRTRDQIAARQRAVRAFDAMRERIANESQSPPSSP
jgi:hypothetical protein